MIQISVDSNRVQQFFEKWDVVELGIFGSALRDDFHAESDIDVLVTFDDNANPTLFDLSAMQMELAEIFGREVDLLTRNGVEQSRNLGRKEAILSSVEILHGA
jgi:hypothetical protein